MATQTIEVTGLPEGWKAVQIKIDKGGYHYIGSDGCTYWSVIVRLEKIQPRRIVLEETETTCNYEETQEFKIGNNSIAVWSTKVLREVKETDIPLTNGEPNIKMGVSQGDGDQTMILTKKDMRELIAHVKLGGQLNPKIAEFIKDK